LAIGICLTAIGLTLSLADAKPNPEANANPLTLKARVQDSGVLNSGGSHSAKAGCHDQDGWCLKEGEKNCLPMVAECGQCCEGLYCVRTITENFCARIPIPVQGHK